MEVIIEREKVDKVLVELIVEAGEGDGLVTIFFECSKMADHIVVNGDGGFLYLFLFGLDIEIEL